MGLVEAYLRKARRFLKAAEDDLRMGHYEKAVSSCWFALEMLARAILIKHFGSAPRKESPLISRIGVLLRMRGADPRETVRAVRRIYIMRKEADHRATMFDLETAKRIYSKCSEVFSRLLKFL